MIARRLLVAALAGFWVAGSALSCAGKVERKPRRRRAAVDAGTLPPPDGTKIAVVRRVRDPAKSCPAAYRASKPVVGMNRGFASEGAQRGFFLRLPDPGKFSGPRPPMVYFHGTNGDGAEIRRFRWADTLLAKGVIVVAPNGEDNGTVWPEWDAMRQTRDRMRKNTDVVFFDQLVDCLSAHLAIDEKRIFISGMSAGGIMSNRIIRERHKLVAGAVVGSGAFELTEPVAVGPLSKMAVIVTWGGDNDMWGGTNAGKTVPLFRFAEQAALASTHYEAAPNIHQVHCRGENLGHRWLNSINGLMADFLLAHPKGQPVNPAWKLVPPPAWARVRCSEAAAKPQAQTRVACVSKTSPGCQSYCQTLATCVVENHTIRGVFRPQLAMLGFAGRGHRDCRGCVSLCEKDLAAARGVDAAVLACMKSHAAKTPCGPGIQGGLKLLTPTKACCAGKTTSRICGRLCRAILKNTVARTFFGFCRAFKP